MAALRVPHAVSRVVALTTGLGAVAIMTAARGVAAQVVGARCAMLTVQVVGDTSTAAPARVLLLDSALVPIARGVRQADGRWALGVPPGLDEVVVEASRGRLTIRRRVPLRAVGARPCHVVLAPRGTVQAFDTVRVVERAPAPPAERFVASLGTGATEALSDGAGAAVPPTEASLLARARTQLAVASTPQGLSFAGLAPSETPQRLNGLVSGIGTLPRALPVRQRVVTSAYDVGVGGFAGALAELEIARAGEFSDVRLETTTAMAPGPALATGRGGTAAPAIAVDAGGQLRTRDLRHGLSVGVRASALRQAPATALGAPAGALAAAGIAAPSLDAVARTLAAAAPTLGAPLDAAPAAWELSAAARLDPWSTFRNQDTSRVTHTLVAALEAARGPLGPSSLGVLPSRLARETRMSGALQWRGTLATARGARWTLNAGARRETVRDATRAPWAAALEVPAEGPSDGMPSPGDAGARGPLLGAGGAPSEGRTVHGLELRAERRAQRGRLADALVFGARVDRARAEVDGPAVIARFATPDDLARAAPERVVVRDGARDAAAHAQRAYVGVGQTRTITRRFRVEYGVRADVQRLALDAAGDAAWQAARTPTPFFVDLSPRLGATWRIGTPKEGEGIRTTPFFTRHLVPAGQLRLGVGRFVGDVEPTALVGGGARAGWSGEWWCGRDLLAPAALREAAWDAERVAALCARAAPAARLDGLRLAEGFRAADARRVTASWIATVRGVDVSVDALHDDGRRKPSVVDANLAAAPWGTAEGGRPLFADPRLRDASGDWPAVAGRADVAVGRDVLLRSDARTRATQVAVSLSPRTGDSRLAVRVGYVWLDSRSRENGWDRDTPGDPRVAEWGPSPFAARHQVQLELGGELHHGIDLTLWVRARSGTAFTPLVDRDVNGDGVEGNDRAFVAWPGTPEGDALRAALAGAPARARACLEAHAGGIAPRGACTGPWSAQSAVQLGIADRFRLPADARLVISLENPLGLAERAVHGDESRGWGRVPLVDPVLLRVQGMDARTGATDVAPNPQFGRLRPAIAGLTSGWRVSVAAALPLAPSIQRQQVTRWLARRGIGTRLPADTLAVRLARNVPDLYALLEEADTELDWEPAQREFLARRRAAYDAARAAVWRDAARDLARLPRSFDVDAAARRVQQASDSAWALGWQHARVLRPTLTPLQERLLPWPAGTLVRAAAPPKMNVVYY